MRRSLAASVAAFALMSLALPALAIDDIVIPLTTVVRGDEGDTFVLAEVATGAEAGCAAVVSATASNNPSVHLGNDLIVASGDSSVVLSDVEATPNKVTTAAGTLTLGDFVTVSLVLGPADPGRPISVFSGGVTVTVSCVPDETTTTTTIPSTTTTEATTTTTVPTSTSVVVTTTSQLITTTTRPPGVSSSIVSTTSTLPPVTGSTLPFTGPGDVAGLALTGIGLLLLGAGLVASIRTDPAEL